MGVGLLCLPTKSVRYVLDEEGGWGFISRQRGDLLRKDDKLGKISCFQWSCVSSFLAGITTVLSGVLGNDASAIIAE